MRLNNIDIVDRNNRPGVNSLVAIRVLLINDGEYVDPSEIRDVMIFQRSGVITPSSVLDTTTGLVSESVSSYVKAAFNVSAQECGPALCTSSYFRGATGVYRRGTGDFVCVLDGVSGGTATITPWGYNFTVSNTVATIGEYFDVWTIKDPSGSDYKVVINEFELFNDAYTAVTEPLMIRAYNTLYPKKVTLGSKTKLKITSEFTVENNAIDKSVANLFKTNIAQNPSIEIVKINEDINLPARVEVSGWSDTSALIDITSKNTFTLNWNTDELRTHAQLLAGNLGSMTGVYYIRIKYTILDEIIISPPLFLQVT